MSKFISISTFETLFDSQASLLSPEGLEKFIAALRSTEGELICRKHTIERWELDSFIESLKNPRHIVFYGWVAQSPTLENMFLGKVTVPYEDKSKHLEHQLAEEYKQFLSPYLAPILLKKTGATKQELPIVFSFTRLLDSDHRAMVEDQLFKDLGAEIKSAVVEAKHVTEEQELISLIQPLCAEEIIASVNYLSRAMYATKLGYVDDLLTVIRRRACTARFANWLLKQLELVELNTEHNYKINDLRAEIKSGELQVRNSMEKGRTPIRWKTIFSGILIVGILGIIAYLIVVQPFSTVEEPEVSDATSFVQFDADERRLIDSMLREISGNVPEEDYYDMGVPIVGGSSATITLRDEYANPTMEEIYENLSKDAELQERGFVDSCTVGTDYKRLVGVDDLSKKKGNVEAMMRNDSEYDVVLFVAEDHSGGAVHSLFLAPGETKVFELNQYNTLLLVAGGDYQQYSAPNVPADELPSLSYTHHFCDTDLNYLQSINTPYILTGLAKGKAKFLITGDLGAYFALLDIHNVLEPM